MSFPRYPEYKDSGVEWLGQLPASWGVRVGRRYFEQRRDPASIEDIQLSATQKYGVVPQSQFMEAEDQKVTLALSGTGNFKHVEKDDFVISLRSFQGGIESCAYIGCVSPAYTVLRARHRIAPRFWAYLLKSAGYISALQSVTEGIRDGKNISYEQFGTIGLPIPDLTEQEIIAAFLDRETAKIDALVAEQEKLIALLKEKRQAVISHAVTKGLNPDAPMKLSGIEWLGDVPAHWEVRRISSLSTKITNGFVGPTRDVLVDQGVRYLQSLHIKGNRIRFDQPYFVRSEWSEHHAKSILETGDVLIVQTGDIGQVAVVTAEFEGCNCHALIIVSPLRSALSGEWLSWVLNSEYGFHSLLSIQTGALHPHLNCGNVKDLVVPVPPLREQDTVVQFVELTLEKFDGLIAEANRAITLLKERRSALISAAVTGQIDVRGLATSAPAASQLAHA